METCSHSGVTAAGSAEDGALARNQAARRRRVLDATLALAAKGGFDAVQMRDVAAEAGVALGTVYRYFASKERLLLEANVEQVEALGARLARRGRRRASTPADRVVDVLRRACHALRRSGPRRPRRWCGRSARRSRTRPTRSRGSARR